MTIKFLIADVFTDRRFDGAQVAVVPDARGLSDAQRHSIANELNLWATVFVEDQGQRRFRMHTHTPLGETSFGSHTAVAASTVLAASGRIGVEAGSREPLVFESAEGLMTVFIEQGAHGRVITLLARQIKRKTDIYVPQRAELAGLLGVNEAQLDTTDFRPLFSNVDHNYLIVPARSHGAVRDAIFDIKAWNSSTAGSMATFEILLFAASGTSSSANFHARLFGPHVGTGEDPPIGAAVPAFVSYLSAHEHVRRGTQSFTIERGDPGTRLSTIEVEMDIGETADIGLRVGGHGVISVRGEVELDGPADRLVT